MRVNQDEYREAIELFADGIVEDIKAGAFASRLDLLRRLRDDVREEGYVHRGEVPEADYLVDAYLEVFKRPEYWDLP